LDGVGFLRTLGVGVGVGFFVELRLQCPIESFLRCTPKSGIPVEILQFLLKLLLKQRILALYRDFH